METELRPGDVVLTRGSGLVSRLIRGLTRTFGEPKTKVNHVGVVVEGGPVETAILVEALSVVKRHGLMQRYGKKSDHVAVYRALNLTEGEIATIVSAAESYVGRTYGYGKIALHFLDWMLLGAYVFRRLGRMEAYPICSWLVATAFAKAGKSFGVEAGAASPDDIWDFVATQTAKYEVVRPLSRLVPGRASLAPRPSPRRRDSRSPAARPLALKKGEG